MLETLVKTEPVAAPAAPLPAASPEPAGVDAAILGNLVQAPVVEPVSNRPQSADRLETGPTPAARPPVPLERVDRGVLDELTGGAEDEHRS